MNADELVRFRARLCFSVLALLAAFFVGAPRLSAAELAEPKTTLELNGGFSLKLGPFGASIDRAGLVMDLDSLSRGVDSLADFVAFSPPKGIGLVETGEDDVDVHDCHSVPSCGPTGVGPFRALKP